MRKTVLYLLLVVLLSVSVSAGWCKDTVTGVCRESVVCLQYDTLVECQGSVACWCPEGWNSCERRSSTSCTLDCYKFNSNDPLADTTALTTCRIMASEIYSAVDNPSDFYQICQAPGESCDEYVCCEGLACVFGTCHYENIFNDLIDDEQKSAETIPNYADESYENPGLFGGIVEDIDSAVTLVDKLIAALKVILIFVVVIMLLPILFIVVGVFGSLIGLIRRLFK